jgi:hypothetical protein
MNKYSEDFKIGQRQSMTQDTFTRELQILGRDIAIAMASIGVGTTVLGTALRDTNIEKIIAAGVGAAAVAGAIAIYKASKRF